MAFREALTGRKCKLISTPRCSSSSIIQLHGELNLPRRVSIVSLKRIGRLLIISREVIEINVFIDKNKLPICVLKAIRIGLHHGVFVIEKVERLDHKIQFDPVTQVHGAGEPHVGGGVAGTDQRIASYAGQTVVEAVAVLVGVPDDAGIYRTAASEGHHVGKASNC